MKITFVGEFHYFKCAMPELLEGHEVRLINLDLHKVEQLRGMHSDVWVLFCPFFFPKGLIDSLSGKKIWASSEPIQRPDVIPAMKKVLASCKGFDLITHYDKTQVSELQLRGIPVKYEFQLPVNLNMYRPMYEWKAMNYDLFFSGRCTPHREVMTVSLKQQYRFMHNVHGLVEWNYVRTLSESLIGLNIHIATFPQLQHRMQNMIACGAFVLSEKLTHDDVLKAGEHFVVFNNKDDLHEKVYYYLQNDIARNKIAKQGHEYVREHFSAEKKWLELINKVV